MAARSKSNGRRNPSDHGGNGTVDSSLLASYITSRNVCVEVMFAIFNGLCAWRAYSWQINLIPSTLRMTLPFVFAFFFGYRALDNLTALLELHRVDKNSRLAWKLFEERLYTDNRARYMEVRPGRTLCVIHLCPEPKSPPPKGLIFFIHGSMARLGQFDAQIKYFFHEQNYEVVAYDFFGMGRSPKSTKIPRAYSTAAHTADMIALYNRVVMERGGSAPLPVHVVGHSFGCSQALRLGLHAFTSSPAVAFKLSSITLLGAGIPSAEKKRAIQQIFGLPLSVLRLLHPFLSTGFRERALDANTIRDGLARPLDSVSGQLLRYVDATSGVNPMHVVSPFYLQSDFICQKEVARLAVLAKLNACRFALITGESDQLCPVDSAQEILEWLDLPRSSLHLIEAASHQVMQEKPSQVNAIMLEVMNGSKRE